MKAQTFRCHIPLYTLLLLSYATSATIMYCVVPPYNSLALAALFLAHLFLVAPLKSRTADICSDTKRGEGIASFVGKNWRLAVGLQLWLWKARLWRYAIAFLPSISLSLLSDWLSVRSHLHVYWLVFSWVIGISSVICLVIGVIIAEFSMLRYMAAWYLLTRINSVKHTVRCAKQLSLYRMEEIAELWLRTLPFAFSHVRAAWIRSQLQSSKHAYISFQNTNTVNGITNA